LTIGIY
jgi:hypothetical protein